MRPLAGKIKTIPKDPQSSLHDETEYSCKEDPSCKDTGFHFYRVHQKTDESINEPDYVTRFNRGEISDHTEWVQFSTECNCRKREREIKRQDRIIGSSRLSPKFQKRTFDRVIWLDPEDWEDKKDQEAVADLVKGQRKAFQIVTEYTENWEEMAINGKGFGLYGDPGVFKTHLLAAKTLKLLDRGISSVFVNTDQLFSEIRKCYETDDTGTVKRVRPSEIIDLVRTAPDLSLDDIGTEDPGSKLMRVFYEILNHRYEWELPTSFSTNLSDEELKNHLTNKTHRRLSEPAAGRCCMIKGPSFERILLKLSTEKRRKYEVN